MVIEYADTDEEEEEYIRNRDAKEDPEDAHGSRNEQTCSMKQPASQKACSEFFEEPDPVPVERDGACSESEGGCLSTWATQVKEQSGTAAEEESSAREVVASARESVTAASSVRAATVHHLVSSAAFILLLVCL